MDEFLYILATGLQVAGGILLIIKYWQKSVKSQLDGADSNRNRIEGETLVLGQTTPPRKDVSKEIWLSRISFIYIVVGYLTGIFGNVGVNRWIDFALIILLSVILCLLGGWVADKLTKN